MKQNTNCLIFAAFVNLLLSHPIFAQEDSFRRLQLSYGISVDVPSHWTILSLDSRKNFRTFSQTIIENAGMELANGRKESLLAINATPNPPGAMIRVSITYPADYTQSDLAVSTSKDLKEVETEMLNAFRQLESSGGPKIIETLPVRIEQINGLHALTIPYVRRSENGPSLWQVTQYKIPVSNHLIEITLSHRQSDAVMWRPILDRVKRSIKF